MSSVKTLNQYGFAAIDEAAYADAESPVLANDGILPSEQPEPAFNYLFDGTRGRSPMGGHLSGVGPTGRGMTLALLAHMTLPEVAYSASAQPSLERLMRYCGFKSQLDVSGGSEKYTLTPESTDFDSGSFSIYTMGELWSMSGAYGTFSIAADGPVIPTWSFDFQGIGTSLMSDVTPVPAITYLNAAKKPYKATGIVLTLGSYAAGVVRSFEFALNRDLSPRANENLAGGHLGFSPGNHDPRLTVTIERQLTGTFNPYSLMEAGTAQNTHLTINTVQYKKWKLTMAQAEIVSVSKEEDGSTALWVIELQGKVSSPELNDDLVFLFD
jgi:hypothetical protein